MKRTTEIFRSEYEYEIDYDFKSVTFPELSLSLLLTSTEGGCKNVNVNALGLKSRTSLIMSCIY